MKPLLRNAVIPAFFCWRKRLLILQMVICLMSSRGVRLKQVPSPRLTLVWGWGVGRDIILTETWSLRGSQWARSQKNHTGGSRNGLSKDQSGAGGVGSVPCDLCLLRAKRGYLVGAGELWIRSRVNWSNNKPYSQRTRAEHGFLPLSLLFKSSGLCSLQMLLCGNLMGWEVIFAHSLVFIGCPQLTLMLCLCVHLNPEFVSNEMTPHSSVLCWTVK